MFSLLLFLLSLMQVSAWPQWGGPARDFSTGIKLSDVNLQSPFKRVWQQEIGLGNSGLVVANKSMFTQVWTSTGLEAVVAMSTLTGETLWKTEYQTRFEAGLDLEFGVGPHSTPCYERGYLFSIGSTGELHKMDATTGDVLWSRSLWSEFPASRLERGFAASPLCWKDSLLLALGGRGCGVVALDFKTGATLWSVSDFEGSYASPSIQMIHETPQLIVLFADSLVAFEPESGRLLWKFDCPPVNTVHVCSPYYQGDGKFLICSSNEARMIQVESADKAWRVRELWNSRAMTPQVGNIIALDGCLVGPSSGSSIELLSSIDPLTGDLLEKKRVCGPGFLLQCLDGLISISDRGQLALGLVEDRKISVVYKNDQFLTGRVWSAPAVVGSTLFIRDRARVQRLELNSR